MTLNINILNELAIVSNFNGELTFFFFFAENVLFTWFENVRALSLCT